MMEKDEKEYSINIKLTNILTIIALMTFFGLSIYFTALQAEKIGFYNGCSSIGLDKVYDGDLKEYRCDNFTRMQQEIYVDYSCGDPIMSHALSEDIINMMNGSGED